MAKLHLGCGKNLLEGYVNMDMFPPADIVRDVLRGIPFTDETFEEILTENFLEHIPQKEVPWLMDEMWRVLKVGGTAHHVIPHAGTMNRWQDPTHVSDWIPETFRYFDVDNVKSSYYNFKRWKIISLEVVNTGQAIDVTLQKVNS